MKIGDSERQIMEVLWAEGPLTAGQIIARVRKKRDWSPKTVHTYLARLLKKQSIARVKDGGHSFYSATLDRKQFLSANLDSFVERFFDGSLSGLVAHFLSGPDVAEDELEKLEAMLEKLRAGPNNHA